MIREVKALWMDKKTSGLFLIFNKKDNGNNFDTKLFDIASLHYRGSGDDGKSTYRSSTLRQ